MLRRTNRIIPGSYDETILHFKQPLYSVFKNPKRFYLGLDEQKLIENIFKRYPELKYVPMSAPGEHVNDNLSMVMKLLTKTKKLMD